MTTPADVLRCGFAHHAWASTTLLDALETLGPEHLDTAIAGTLGSIAATMTHLGDADDRYLQRCTTPVLPPVVERAPDPIAVLREWVADHRARWEQVLDQLDAGSLHARVDKPGYPITEPAETLLLLQALQHGNEHRAQVCSTLGASGLHVPDLDVWEFWRLEPSARR